MAQVAHQMSHMRLNSGEATGNGYGNIYQSYTESNRVYTESRITRIRAAMFGYDGPSTSDAPSRSTIVDALSTPSRNVKDAVVELLQFEGETDINSLGIADLVELMANQDESVVARAVHRVHLLSKEDRTIASYPLLVDSLIRAARSDNPNVKRDAVGALTHVSESREGSVHIFRSGGLEELIAMLYSRYEKIMHYAVTTLRNLLMHVDQVKVRARALGAIQALSGILCNSQNTDYKLLAQVSDSIYFLLLDDPHSKLEFLALGGPQTVVRIMRTYTDVKHSKLIYTLIRCIRSLSVCPQNKPALISLGCLPVLFSELRRSTTHRTRLAILVSIRNLSDAATNEENLQPLVMYLLAAIREAGQDIREARDEKTVAEIKAESACACGILSNLTCNNEHNKQTVCAKDGIAALVGAIQIMPDVEEATEPALCALRHCTARHSLAEQAQNELRLCGSFPVLLSLLATLRAPVIKAALGVIRNSALLAANLVELTQERTIDNQSVVSLSVDILNRATVGIREDPEAETDGVSLWGIIEGAVSALHQLAAHPAVAVELYDDQGFLNMIVELLDRPEVRGSADELIERELLGLLYQLSKTPDGARAVESTGAIIPLLMDSLRSQHRSLATYASGVLRNLDHDRAFPNRQDLDMEIGAGWQRDGLEPELFGEMYPVHGMDSHQYPMPHNNSSWFDTDL